MQHAEHMYDPSTTFRISDRRTHHYHMDTLSNPTRMDDLSSTLDPRDNTALINIEPPINIQIYRYTFTTDFMNQLSVFSKVHQYDHRKVFKEAWEVWLEENENIVALEDKRLKELGYDGNVTDKMFKSARYYFRKKSTEKKALTERREYVGTQRRFLDAIDKHILSGLATKNVKPSDGFDDFCKTNLDFLKNEVELLCKHGFRNSDEIKHKIKKTYKNRYFLLTHNQK